MESGTFKVKGTDRTFTINYSECTLTVGDKVIDLTSTVEGPMAQEEGDIFIKGPGWYLGWTVDEGRYRHLQFMENNEHKELELIKGGWPEDFL